jgi:UDP-N-acetylglucosamine 2-epimerase (non-hydrolysing)
MIVFGTRPEAIKMAPLIKEIKNYAALELRVCITGQHREMLDQVLKLFKIIPDYDLALMSPGQTLNELTGKVIAGMERVFEDWRPELVFVHGDTTTTFAASLAAYYQKIAVYHVEAGLRTQDIYSPWPEELNRRMVGAIAAVHFAPTQKAAQNLMSENIATECINIIGNTVIDALLEVNQKIESDVALKSSISKQFPFLDKTKRLVLVTAHRRENFGAGFESICNAISTISKRNDVQIVYPVHLNPSVQEPVYRILKNNPNVHLIAPQDYLPFIFLMSSSYIILTDSGGIQEEAPSLGKPVLVLRDNTERPEAVHAGTVILVGTEEDKIVKSVENLLDNIDFYNQMSIASNPYGDGNAAKRIVANLFKEGID